MKTPVIPLLLLLPFAWSMGCRGSDDDGDSNTPSGENDVSTFSCPSLSYSCPSSLVDIGTAGEYAVDSMDVTWQYSEQCAASYAPFIYFNVPNDIESLSITVEHEDYNGGFALLAMGGEAIVDWSDDGSAGWGAMPHGIWPAIAGTIVFPQNEDSYPNTGCLAFRPIIDLIDVTGETGRVSIVSRRKPVKQQAIDLNVIVADGTGISREDLEAAVAHMASVYTNPENPQLAVDINAVSYYSVALESGPYIDYEGDDINTLRATQTDGDGHQMNLFFIADFVGSPGILGIAAGIPGPIGISETYASGVVMSVESHQDVGGNIDIELLGETMAHEAGHQMGLFHTTESSGEYFDGIGDTPECDQSRDANGDGDVSADECQDLDGMNIMFWAAAYFRQWQMTPYQADMLIDSPIAY